MPVVIIGTNTGDAGGADDAGLYESNPTGNFGTDNYFDVGPFALGDVNRAILRFDLSPIVGPVVVASAVLSLYQAGATGGGTHIFGCYRVAADWLEAEVSWARRSVADPWITPGGDAAGAPTGADAFDATSGIYKTIAGLEADVEDWINNGGNFGWLFRDTTEAPTASFKTFLSRENSDGVRPFLTIDYEPAGGANAARAMNNYRNRRK